MIELMGQDEKIVTTTAGMPDGTGLSKVVKEFPDRTFDVGIAESHATDSSAGMAKAGLKPFVTIYSTFMQRAFDQVFQEVALQGLPVRFAMDRAGLVGGDGAVHHGFLDIAFLRGLPGMVLLAAADEPNLKAALKFMADYEAGPSAVRYPRDKVPDPLQHPTPPFELGKANKLAAGEDVAILAYGHPVCNALKARQDLFERGISAAVYDARFAKPVDVELLQELIEGGTPILTVEDHARIGGFGSAVLEACNEAGLPTQGIRRLGLPDRFVYQGGRGEQLAEVGLDADGITQAAHDLVLAWQRRLRASPAETSQPTQSVGIGPTRAHPAVQPLRVGTHGVLGKGH
jgi:1-deoxy-D-xylulose-5-phosphate synthase